MSGIVGFLSLDGRPSCTDGMSRAMARLAHRGADGARTWESAGVTLGHLAFNTTPEAIRERQPQAGTRYGHVVTADARIDNREELHQALGMRQPLSRATDADLILAAYEKWGTECARRLTGAFAFAIWDPHERHLFCARDHFGHRPFYYHHAPGRQFVFASEIKGVCAFDGIPDAINEFRVADYLSDVVYDEEYTFYSSIVRLPAAHTLVVGGGGAVRSRYWALDPEREVRFERDEEYAEALRETFTEAVRCRLRAPDPVGVTLSGGLDSSAVAVVGEDFLRRSGRTALHSFSNVYEQVPECDERPYIEAVLSRGDYAPHFIEGDKTHFPLRSIQGFLDALDQPFFAPGLASSDGLRRRFREAGVRVVLSGHGGDEVISQGLLNLKELAVEGEWRRLLHEVRHLGDQESGGARGRLLLQYILYGCEARLRGHRITGPLQSILGYARRRVQASEAGSNGGARPAADYVNPALAAAVDLASRQEAAGHHRPPRTERERHFRILTHPMQALGLEILEGTAAANGYEERIPFWDRRLVELCLALPTDQKRRHGQGRYVLRRALHDSLPAIVRERRDKARFNANLVYGLLRNDGQALQQLLRSLDGIEGYVNVGALREDLTTDRLERDISACYLLLKVAALSRWSESRCDRLLDDSASDGDVVNNTFAVINA